MRNCDMQNVQESRLKYLTREIFPQKTFFFIDKSGVNGAANLRESKEICHSESHNKNVAKKKLLIFLRYPYIQPHDSRMLIESFD